MKFKKPSQGTYRIVKRFAWFPVDTKEEIIWLETYYVEQIYDYTVPTFFEKESHMHWYDVYPATEEEYNKYIKEMRNKRKEIL